MVAGIATLKLNLSAFSSSMSSFTASSSSSSFPSFLPMRTPSSSKPRCFSESLRSFPRFFLTMFHSLLTYAFSFRNLRLDQQRHQGGHQPRSRWCSLARDRYFFFFAVLLNCGFVSELWRFLTWLAFHALEFLHVKPGKGAAFVRTKLKNYITGNTVEKTFRAGSSVMHTTLQCFCLITAFDFIYRFNRWMIGLCFGLGLGEISFCFLLESPFNCHHP